MPGAIQDISKQLRIQLLGLKCQLLVPRSLGVPQDRLSETQPGCHLESQTMPAVAENGATDPQCCPPGQAVQKDVLQRILVGAEVGGELFIPAYFAQVY